MAVCPRCGKEQNCGCERCHDCGAELADRLSAVPAPSSKAPVEARTTPYPEPSREAAAPTSSSPSSRDAATRAVQMVLLLVGAGILSIALVEAARAVGGFSPSGPASSFTELVKRAGYYLGNLLYSNSTRTITGVGFIAAGLMLGRLWPFREEERRRRMGVWIGWSLCALSSVYLVDIVLLLLPAQERWRIDGSLLPQLWAAVLVILVTGATLLLTGCIFLGEVAGFGIQGRSRARRSRRAGGDRAAPDREEIGG